MLLLHSCAIGRVHRPRLGVTRKFSPAMRSQRAPIPWDRCNTSALCLRRYNAAAVSNANRYPSAKVSAATGCLAAEQAEAEQPVDFKDQHTALLHLELAAYSGERPGSFQNRTPDAEDNKHGSRPLAVMAESPAQNQLAETSNGVGSSISEVGFDNLALGVRSLRLSGDVATKYLTALHRISSGLKSQGCLNSSTQDNLQSERLSEEHASQKQTQGKGHGTMGAGTLKVREDCCLPSKRDSRWCT